MNDLLFGLNVSGNTLFTPEKMLDIAARLFLCTRISPESASRMLDGLLQGKFTENKLYHISNIYLQDMQSQKESDPHILGQAMCNKYELWANMFAEPTDSDFDYLERTYDYSKSDFMRETALICEQPTTPVDLKNYVAQYIKGQDHVIKKLSVPIFLLNESDNGKNYKINRSVVLVGRTGSGKSAMIQRFKEACGCAVVWADLSTLQPDGWRGTSLKSVFASEINAGNIETREIDGKLVATSKILFVGDEFDKITHYGATGYNYLSDASDMDMQSELMHLMNPDTYIHIDLSGDLFGGGSFRKCEIPVNNILCVFAGAFDGIEDTIIKKRLNVGRIGFDVQVDSKAQDTDLLRYVSKQDLVAWGYRKELLSRIGIVTALNPLTPEVIYDIMTTAKDNAVQRRQKYLMTKNIDLQFDDDALRYIAEVVAKSEYGARVIDDIFSETISPIIYDLPATNPDQTQVVRISKEYMMQNVMCNN